MIILVCEKFSNMSYPAAVDAKSPQLCPTLCDPIDRSPPGSSIPGIFQGRTLEWIAIAFSGYGDDTTLMIEVKRN